MALANLIMARNPLPTLASTTTTVPSAPVTGIIDGYRDDFNPIPAQDYKLDEVTLNLTLSGAPTPRTLHGFLAYPPGLDDLGLLPTAIVLNGHGGSAYGCMVRDSPQGVSYWYGDSFASVIGPQPKRERYIVLALDIGHRPSSDRDPRYDGYGADDDAALPGAPSNMRNGPHPAIQSALGRSDFSENGERVWDVVQSLTYLLGTGPVKAPDHVRRHIDPKRLVLTGHSMGGEIATFAGALDDRFAVVVPSGYASDTGSDYQLDRSPTGHACSYWQSAYVSEYIDGSDLHGLTAPRGLVLVTGIEDWTASSEQTFYRFKQVARRSKVAYSPGDQKRFIHYMHERGHIYRAAGTQPHPQPTVTLLSGVRVPTVDMPPRPFDINWQRDRSTRQLSAPPGNLFDLIRSLLP